MKQQQFGCAPRLKNNIHQAGDKLLLFGPVQVFGLVVLVLAASRTCQLACLSRTAPVIHCWHACARWLHHITVPALRHVTAGTLMLVSRRHVYVVYTAGRQFKEVYTAGSVGCCAQHSLCCVAAGVP